MNNMPQTNKPSMPTTSANGGGIGGAVKDTVNTVKDTVGNVADKVTDAASNVGQRVSHAASDVYAGAKDVGHTAERWAEDAYDATRRNVGQFGDEVGTLIRNHPIPAVLIGFGVGLLLGRAAKAL